MLLDVVLVKANEDLSLDLLFESGEWRRFDMKPLLAVKPWCRIDLSRDFRRARAEHGTVVWPAPETLYDESVPLADATLGNCASGANGSS